jgi:Uncharacterised protein family (UPF0236)
MDVQITVTIDGREEACVKESFPIGQAIEIEEQVERVKDRVGQVVLEKGFEQLADQLRSPCCCGRAMENRGFREITLMSLSGEVRVPRRRYRCRECGGFRMPADALICCGPHRITRALAKRVCELATLEHFPELEQLVANQHGVFLGHEEMRQLVHEVGQAAEADRLADVELWQQTAPEKRRWPEAEHHPRRVYVSCDGIMYCTNQREPDPHHPGQNRLIWKQMRVGCVYWQAENGSWRKRVLWGQEDVESFGASLFRLACRCGYAQAEEKIFVADGGEWCWSIREKYFAGAEGILDWYHASEHVWTCGKALHDQPDETKAWVDQALELLREKGGSGLWAWLKEQRSKTRGKKRNALDKLIRYLGARKEITDYPRYRQNDWQIGSGMIESTARQLVGQRLKGPGMHWTPEGATAVTALRAQRINQVWHQFWKQLHLANPPTATAKI